MNQEIINLWADIGSEDYWRGVLPDASQIFVSFQERWPQPGFVGHKYLESQNRIMVMGQNPRARNTIQASDSDKEMFRLIRNHGASRNSESLEALFSMMQKFMRGISPYYPSWRPITAAEKHLGLSLEDIAYLNLIPLATYSDRIVPEFRQAFDLSTRLQLEALKPDKIVVYGKGAFEKFQDLGTEVWDTRYIEQRNYNAAPSVRTWINNV